MVACFFCACCSGKRDRRQQYRYEVVYRREESLYSGPDYLESLPGGLQASQGPNSKGNPAKSHKYYSEEERQPLQLTSGGQCSLPLPTPLGVNSLTRQNRVNHYLTTLNPLQFPRPPVPPPPGSRPARPPIAPSWKSTPYLGYFPPTCQSVHLPYYPSQRAWHQTRSAPTLSHSVADASNFSPLISVDISQDQSIGSSSKDVSREHSLASSSANSTRPLLPESHFSLPAGSSSHLLLSIRPGSGFAAENRPRFPNSFCRPRPPLLRPPKPPPFNSHSQRYRHHPPPGSITRDLRHYLSTRFPKGGTDHEQQTTIRDNVYLRTVPVTTRSPRPGEVDGVDYTFLSYEEFLALQRSGSLLEAGVFEGNHYGTPKPTFQAELQKNQIGSTFFPGAHPSSEGKRRRNRSNVEAMAANIVSSDAHGNPTEGSNPSFSGPCPHPPPRDEEENALLQSSDPNRELGPLPPNWEKAYTENGEPYFIDHVAGTSSWLDPRLARFQKRNPEDCSDNELPFGWERIDDPQYGTYYIDHVNRKTQYENPVIVARRQHGEETEPPPPPPNSYGRSTAFTKNPSELAGEFIQTTLVKSSRGLGFTIVGGDDNEEEFLQIKSVVPNGPAWQDSKLKTGDILVYVNDTCVLGYTHADVVNMFQNIEPSCTVHLEVCRGYPLPFDPNDPNTEIVTTVAVTNSDMRGSKSLFGGNFEGRQSRNSSSESMNTAKSMPDLSKTERVQQVPRPGSADLLSSENFESSDNVDMFPGNISKPEYLTIPIIKGNMGFGFTIADSAYGQKVKKILDRSRCKNLSEGDILVDINNINVKGMNHTEVVQVLKDCPQGQEAIIMVQRGSLSPPLVSQQSTIRKTISSPKKGSNPNFGMYRSKTPTAEMYSSQPKEIIPNRPKTPLVDTRNNAKSNHPVTTNSLERPQNRCEPIQEFIQPYQNNGNPPFPGAFSYTTSNVFDPHFDAKINNISNDMTHSSLNGNEAFTDANKYPNYPEDEKDFAYKYYNRSAQDKENFPLPSHSRLPKNAQTRHTNHYPYYNYPNEHMNIANFNDITGHSMHHNADQKHLITYPRENFDIPRQDSGYSSQTQIPPSKNHFSSYYSQNNSIGYSSSSPGSYRHGDFRKESTSFESEHPASVIPPRIPNFNSNIGSLPRGSPLPGPPNPYQEFSVALHRQENGFGFRIVGGTEEGSQVSIGLIVPGGAADQEGSIMNGDEIVAVDGQSVMGSSHHQVVQLMASAASQGRVTLHLRRPRHLSLDDTQDMETRSTEIQYPYDVTVARREYEGFGFVIISSVTKSGSTIGRIIENSPAERCSKLHVGDRILRVNGIDIKDLHHGDIVTLIKESGYTVTLTIGPPRDDASSSASNSQQAESEMGDEGDLYQVELHRGVRGFGFSIRGGKEFHNMPLFVLRIAENGPAAEDGKLMVGDQLIEINGVPTKDMTHAEAIELIKHCGSSVALLMRRGNKFIPNLESFSSTNLGSPVGPPPPNVYMRSTATLPSGSPSTIPLAPPNSNTQYYNYAGSSNYPSYYHAGGGGDSNSTLLPQPNHSSPESSVPHYPHMLVNPHMTNGPLGQSSPRMPPSNSSSDHYYWKRMPPEARPT